MCYYGPFQISEKISDVAYRLKLRENWTIHIAFHVSLLRPFVGEVPILGLGYFVIKVILVLFLFIWVRASIARVRYDQLMAFCWKFLLPVSLAYLAVTAVITVLIG